MNNLNRIELLPFFFFKHNFLHGFGRGGGGGGSIRNAGKSTDHLSIIVSEWTSGDWCAHVTVCVCVCV